MKDAIRIQNLSFSYGRQPVLKDISFEVRQGEFLIIIGPNGSGKTTLVKAISGIKRPRGGDVQILGRAVQSYTRKDLAGMIAFVPQSVQQDFPFTVSEVVLMGRSPHLGLLRLERKEDLEIAWRAMAFVRVEHLAGRRLDRLSGGERQLVFIARALCQEPRIIFLDEPTASLDPAHQVRIMDLMQKLREERAMTVVMVSHDLNLASMYAERLVLLKEGRLLRRGRPFEVLTRQALEAAYDCVLLVDEDPLRGTPRITRVPEKFLHAAGTSSSRNRE